MSALNSSVVSAAITVGARLVLEKKNTSGHHYKSGACNTASSVMTGRSCSLRRGHALVFINRHCPTMNLVEEKQRELIPPGLQSWPLQLIEHLTSTTGVAPPPASPAGCRPLYLLHRLNPSGLKIGAALSSLGRTNFFRSTPVRKRSSCKGTLLKSKLLWMKYQIRT